jgi:hypothetical protein
MDEQKAYDAMRDIERRLAECPHGDDALHARLNDELCAARRLWRQYSGRQAGWDAVAHPVPRRNDRIP